MIPKPSTEIVKFETPASGVKTLGRIVKEKRQKPIITMSI